MLRAFRYLYDCGISGFPDQMKGTDKAMERNNEASVSSMKISEDVIASVIKYAVCDVDGVAGLYGRQGRNSDIRRSISMELGSDFPEVTVKLLVTPNCKVSRVCENVQKRVRDDMMSMTGIALSKINIKVEGIAQTVNA